MVLMEVFQRQDNLCQIQPSLILLQSNSIVEMIEEFAAGTEIQDEEEVVCLQVTFK